MIRLDMPQGSNEWLAARIGIPTASRFDNILTPKTMKLSASADGYRNELIAEWMLGVSLDSEVSAFMQRGTEMEDSAVSFYELQRECDTEEVGFILTDDRLAGCSPDRLVGTDGGLEIKCPSAAVHVGYLMDGIATKYACQVQGAMWITGRAWWDMLSYHPTLPPALLRMHRDDVFIAALSVAVAGFVERLAEAKAEMIRRGFKVAA